MLSKQLIFTHEFSKGLFIYKLELSVECKVKEVA